LLAFAAFACIDAGAAAFYGGKSPSEPGSTGSQTLLIMPFSWLGAPRARVPRTESAPGGAGGESPDPGKKPEGAPGVAALPPVPWVWGITVIKPEIQPGTLDTASGCPPRCGVWQETRDEDRRGQTELRTDPGHGLAEAKREVMITSRAWEGRSEEGGEQAGRLPTRTPTIPARSRDPAYPRQPSLRDGGDQDATQPMLRHCAILDGPSRTGRSRSSRPFPPANHPPERRSRPGCGLGPGNSAAFCRHAATGREVGVPGGERRIIPPSGEGGRDRLFLRGRAISAFAAAKSRGNGRSLQCPDDGLGINPAGMDIGG